ncbi:MAG: XdhC family protein [Acidobacteriota bacterium]
MFDIIETINEWLRQKRKIALATVAATWGSSPRQAGSKMGITDRLEMVGSVSGGCVESAVVREASRVLVEKTPRLLYFGVSDDQAWEVGLSCGGQLWVYLEPLDQSWWNTVAGRLQENRPAATVTLLEEGRVGEKMVLSSGQEIAYVAGAFDSREKQLLQEAAEESLGKRVPGRAKVAGLEVMIDLHLPRPRLIMVGGAHVAVTLQRLAREMGFRVILVDPRQAFASRQRFPDVEILHSYPDEALRELGVDSETYITVLTHDPKIDDPALCLALPSAAPYVGVLSSRKTHQKRLARLTSQGLEPHLLERIRTPIGLDIGARSPEEIALAIMAEIVAVRNGGIAPQR